MVPHTDEHTNTHAIEMCAMETHNVSSGHSCNMSAKHKFICIPCARYAAPQVLGV